MDDRIFISKGVNGEDIELRFKSLNQVILTKGDFVYRENFSKAVRAGMITNAEALKILKEREIWGSEQEEKLASLQVSILELEEKLNMYDERTAESLSIYDSIKLLRSEADDISRLKSSIVDNTAESIASEMRTQFFASECTVYNSSGKRVFSDFKEFLVRLDENVTLDSYRQALIINYERALGITIPDKDELSSVMFHEDKWLKEVRSGEEVEEVEEVEKSEDSPKQDLEKIECNVEIDVLPIKKKTKKSKTI